MKKRVKINFETTNKGNYTIIPAKDIHETNARIKKEMRKTKTKKMDGLSEKISQILESHADNIRRYKEQEASLMEKIKFCREHNFEEEKRILLVKYNETNLMLYRYSEMFNEVQKAVENWNS